MNSWDKPRRPSEPATGLLLPLACVLLGAALAWWWTGRLPRERPPSGAPPPGEPPAAGAPSVPTLAPAPTPHAASYRGGMGLAGVFPPPCPVPPVAIRWRVAAGGTPAGGVVWNGTRFLVALAEGTLLALEPDGREAWRRGAALEGIAAPAVTDGTRAFVVSPKGTLAAFRMADGELLWRSAARVDFPVRNAPVLSAAGLVVISQDDGRLLSADPATGALQWLGQPTARCDGPLSTGRGMILFGNCDAAIQLHTAATGAPRWSLPLGGDAQVAGAVSVAGDRAACGTRSGEVVMLELAEGRLLWRTALDDGEVFAAPVLTDDLVVVTTAAASVVALSAKDGHVRWRHRTEALSATSPILVGDHVVLAAAGTVMALDAGSGETRWRLSVGDATTEPCAGNGLIVVGTDEGDVVAIASR